MRRILKIILLTASVSMISLFAPCVRAEVTLTTLVTFDGTNGYLPEAGLVQAKDGNFYGTLAYGGWYDDGLIYRMTPNGKCIILVTFDGENGSHPDGLIQGKEGNFYGATLQGGPAGNGSVFKMTPDSKITTLAVFKDDLYYGPWGLVQGRDGNFYGQMSQIISSTDGSTFKVTLDGKLTIPVTNGMPTGTDGLLKAKDGSFYGTTFSDRGDGSSRFGFGTVYKTGHDGVRTTLVVFNQTNGANPLGDLVQGRDGNIYGITTSGGAFNQGTVFRLNLTRALSPAPTNVNVPILIHAVSNKVDPRIMDAMQAPIDFYGKVVDEKSNAVSNAGVSFRWSDLTARGFENSSTAQSDSNGLFSLTGKQGGSLTVSVGKNGYYTFDRWGKTFFYSKMDAGRKHIPDPLNPVIFYLRKKGQGVELIASENGMRPDVWVRVPKDGTPVRVDFFQKQPSVTGQLEISQIKPPWQGATNWSFRLHIPEGGLVENQDEFQFEAPETGYQTTVGYDFKKGETNWTTQVTKQFYITFGQPRKYGWLRIESNLAQETIFLTYAINPTGSRNLEPQ
jgi:uncharacterized repeat protein (TIGR03803 family)